MRTRSLAVLGALSTLLLATGPSGGRAQQPAPSPAPSHEERSPDPPPKNLQVLPKDWTRREVIDRVMKSWTAALGVRCQHCHVGEEGKPFSEWDFASDANPEKQRAREMVRMLEEINRRLAAMPEMHGAAAGPATCYTCHRGVPQPKTIESVFEETRASSGLPAAIARYRELRAQNLVRGAYDFGAMPLVRLARARLAADDPAGAGEVLALAVELGHDTLATRTALAEAALAQGDRAAALAHLEKALAHASNAAEREFVEGEIRKARGEAQAPQP